MLQKMNSQNLTAGAIALIGVVLFSAKSVFAKMVYGYGVDPVSVIYLRMLIAFPLVALVGILYERKHKTDAIHWRDVVTVIAISILGYYISSLFDFIGLLYVEAAIERLILFLYPTMVIILSALFMGKKIKLPQIIAITIAYIGLLIAFSDKLAMGNKALFWYGVVLIVISSFTYAIFLVMSDGLIGRLGSIRFTTIAILTMCVSIITHALITHKAKIEGYPGPVYINCAIMAVFSTVIPVYLFNYAIEKLGSSNVSIISCAGPVCTLLYSAALLKEAITVVQILGTIVVVGGILTIYLRKKQEVKV